MSQFTQRITLSDGRMLSYDEYGPADGAPLFYFHGTPSSRLEWRLFGGEPLATRLRLRVIAMDRPGMGLSTFQRGRRPSDWPADVAALADALGIERFAVLGFSGGGPYAAACAVALPTRLTSVAIVSGAAPFLAPGCAEGVNPTSRQFFDLCRTKPLRGRLLLRMMGLMARYAPQPSPHAEPSRAPTG